MNVDHNLIRCEPGVHCIGVTLAPSMSTSTLTQLPICQTTKILVNPKVCSARSIYINKSFNPTTIPTTVQSTQKSERVYYNPKFLKHYEAPSVPSKPSVKSQAEVKIHINPNFIKQQNSKLISTELFSSNSNKENAANFEKSTHSIHVNPMFYKSITSQPKTQHIPTNVSANPLPSTSDFKSKFVSKYKIVRKKNSLTNKSPFKKINYYQLKHNLTPIRKKRLKITKGKYTLYYKQNKIDQSKLRHSLTTEFKCIGRNKLVRKSVLQKQIESRMQTRKISKQSVGPSVQKILSPRKKSGGDKVTKYKIIRTAGNVPTNKAMTRTSKESNINKKKPFKRKGNSMVFSSKKYRDEKRNKVVALTGKLRKNNQPCPFFARYGRCKGKEKGTCLKLHDPDYIAVCRRFLKGDCSDEKCLLSHVVKPGKLPTCHHYLAGLCSRTDCPYLHIKVNPRAPVCRAFLHGFCPDVFNCDKRHEYICPQFAAGTRCPRPPGSCPYPHRTPAPVANKLLEDDQLPLLNRKKKRPPPAASRSAEEVSNRRSKSASPSPERTTLPSHRPNKEFKRYFLESLDQDTSGNTSS